MVQVGLRPLVHVVDYQGWRVCAQRAAARLAVHRVQPGPDRRQPVLAELVARFRSQITFGTLITDPRLKLSAMRRDPWITGPNLSRPQADPNSLATACGQLDLRPVVGTRPVTAPRAARAGPARTGGARDAPGD